MSVAVVRFYDSAIPTPLYALFLVVGSRRRQSVTSRPDAGYLRHCVLAVTKAGPAALDSFLDETFLVDRETPLRSYLDAHPYVMETLPPESLVGRYSG